MGMGRKIGLFVSGLFWWNRCPHCDEPFAENGEGSLDIVTHVEDGVTTSAEVLGFCLTCLRSGHMDPSAVAEHLRRRGYEPETIGNAIGAVERFNAGELAFDVWRETESS